MKYKKLILILSIFIIFFTYIIHPVAEEMFIDTEGFKDEIIRFHIRANSDMEEDQDLKLKIRDEILKKMGDEFKDTKDLEESRKKIINNMDEMKTITENIIEKEGKNYSVELSLEQDEFPTRKYGNLVVPAGEYETLLIKLGEGKGQNWWCIMFPPLCFVDITHSVAYNVEERIEETKEEREEPKLKLKWKIVDIAKNIFK